MYAIISTATREAMRYGSSTGLNDVGGSLHYNDCVGIRKAAQNVDFLGIISDANIVISYDHGSIADMISGTCPPPSSEKLITGDRISVQISGEYAPIISIIPLSPPLIVSQSSRTLLFNIQILGTVEDPIFSTYTPHPSRTPTTTIMPTSTATSHHPHTPIPSFTPSRTPTLGSPTPTTMICAVTGGMIHNGINATWIVYNPHVMAYNIEFNMLRLEWEIPMILRSVWFNNVLIFEGNTKLSGILIPLPSPPTGSYLSLPPGESTFEFRFDTTQRKINANILLHTPNCDGIQVYSK